MKTSRRTSSGIKSLQKLLIVFLAGSLVLSASCSRSEQPARETRYLMGTLVEITAYPATDRTRQAVNRAFARMEEIEDQADPYGSQTLEDLRRGNPSLLPAALSRILDVAMTVADRSSGAFDPTVGRAVRLWGFDGADPGIPPDSDLTDAVKTFGYSHLAVGPDNVARPLPPGRPLWLELGGVAKGYAVDEAADILVQEGVEAGIVNAGGDLRSFGPRPGWGQWRIGIQDPDDPQGLLGVLKIEGGSVATSGDYERYFEKDGVRYHHILDPANGRPSRSGIRSVTVIAETCALADALATAAFVMGPEKGLRLLETFTGVEGILVKAGGDLVVTSGIGERFDLERR